MSQVRRIAFALFSLTLAACSTQKAAPPSSTDEGGVSSPAGTPLYRKTTSGAIAVGNLNDRLVGLKQRVRARPEDLKAAVVMVESLLERAAFLGTYDDFDSAVAIAETAVKAHPADPNAWLLRAKLRSHLHAFDDSLEDLERAEKLGAEPSLIAHRRQGISIARGEPLDEILAARRAAFEKHPTYTTAVELASVRLARGEYEEADLLFRKGLERYVDVSPFVVGWVFFQRGVMWSEHAGQPERARRLYQEAVRRLPAYAQANVHLAELEAESGEVEAAIGRLRLLLETSTDPEPAGFLSELLEKRGEHAESALFLERAKKGYEELLSKYPLAFADHGAEFFLGPGADTARALELAKLNLKNRRTNRAFRLRIAAELAAGSPASACKTADEALKTGAHIADLLPASRKAYAACGRPGAPE